MPRSFWTWFLNFLCSQGYKTISWILVVLPFIIFILMILVVIELMKINNVKENFSSTEDLSKKCMDECDGTQEYCMNKCTGKYGFLSLLSLLTILKILICLLWIICKNELYKIFIIRFIINIIF